MVDLWVISEWVVWSCLTKSYKVYFSSPSLLLVSNKLKIENRKIDRLKRFILTKSDSVQTLSRWLVSLWGLTAGRKASQANCSLNWTDFCPCHQPAGVNSRSVFVFWVTVLCIVLCSNMVTRCFALLQALELVGLESVGCFLSCS